MTEISAVVDMLNQHTTKPEYMTMATVSNKKESKQKLLLQLPEYQNTDLPYKQESQLSKLCQLEQEYS